MQAMQTAPPIRYHFDVRVLDNSGEELVKLIPQLDRHDAELGNLMEEIQHSDLLLSQDANRKLYSIIVASLVEVTNIQKVVRDRIIDIHYKMGLSDKYKIVVAYDTVHQLPQAIGLVVLNQSKIQGKNTVGLYSLITSIWNLNFPKNENHPHRVKGAGSAIMEYCKNLGVESQAKYLYITAPPGAIPFCEKHGFKRLNPVSIENGMESDPVGIMRTGMYFDLEVNDFES